MNIPVYRDATPQELTVEQEALKQHLYDSIPQRRRKFIDRMGYDNWDPFPKPNDPMELRTDITKRTTQQLVREFMQSRPAHITLGNAYAQGALETALGLVNKDDKALGVFEFCVWYHELLEREDLI